MFLINKTIPPPLEKTKQLRLLSYVTFISSGNPSLTTCSTTVSNTVLLKYAKKPLQQFGRKQLLTFFLKPRLKITF